MATHKKKWLIAWNRGHGEVQSLGGMVGPVTFQTDQGRNIEPLAVAHWAGSKSPEMEKLPGIIKGCAGNGLVSPSECRKQPGICHSVGLTD